MAAAATFSQATRFENTTLLTGWLLMLLATTQLMLRSGAVFYAETIVAATVIAGIVMVFLFLLRPRLGSYQEWRGVVSAFVVFVTSVVGFSHVLANKAEWALAEIYHAAQAWTARLLSALLGEQLATFTSSPLYWLIAILLLLAFAYRSFRMFLAFIVLLLLYGLYPPDAGIITGYLLWFAGYLLIAHEVLYLPRRIEERLQVAPETRDLLLEVRQRPLTEREVLFFLGAHEHAGQWRMDHVQAELHKLASAGLVEYSADTGKVYPSELLQRTHLPEGVEGAVDVLSKLAGGVMLLAGIVYFAVPTDVMPELLLGPLGYLDDLIVLGVGALPTGSQLLNKLRGRNTALTHTGAGPPKAF